MAREQPREVPWRPDQIGKVGDLKMAKKKGDKHVYMRFMGNSEDGRIRANDLAIDPAEEFLGAGVGSVPLSRDEFNRYRSMGYYVAAHLTEGWKPTATKRKEEREATAKAKKKTKAKKADADA